MDFDKNVGDQDRIIRLIGGAVLGFLAVNALIDSCVMDYYAPVFGALSIILIYTGLTQKCLCNKIIGLDTTKFDDRSE
jgi:hypothetical protein